MTELEQKQHEYIVFLQDRLNEAESALRTQSWWGGFSQELENKGRELRASIVKLISKKE